MAIKTSELTKLISEAVTRDVAKKLIPKLRRIVREEVDRGMKDLLYEMVVKQGLPLRGNDTLQTEEDRPQNVSAAKTFIAKRQASKAKAKQIIENNFKDDDPFADLILNAEDPQEDLDAQQEQLLDQPMKKSKDVSKGDSIMPENIDFTEKLIFMILTTKTYSIITFSHLWAEIMIFCFPKIF